MSRMKSEGRSVSGVILGSEAIGERADRQLSPGSQACTFSLWQSAKAVQFT
jgi:hypothetical protein